MPDLLEPTTAASPPASRRVGPRRAAAPRREPRMLPPADRATQRSLSDLEEVEDGRLQVGGVTWDVYVALADHPDNAHLRFAFDGDVGLLEIEMPAGSVHETVAELLTALVSAYLRHRRVEFRPTGSMTLRRQTGRGRGLRADKTYYVRTLGAVRGKAALSLLDGDPPPDLALEVDVTSRATAKLPIYAALGVPEVWNWEDGAFTVRRLTADGDYDVVEESEEVAGFPLAAAADLVGRLSGEGQNAVLDAFEAHLPAD